MTEPQIDELLRADLVSRLAAALDFKLMAIRPIATTAVTTNRLLHVVADDGREAFAKIYHQDARNRLAREYAALSRLQSEGVARIPHPLLRCDEHQYAVYSFASGAAQPAAAYSTAYGAEVGRFAADLSRLRAGPDDPLPVARGALISLADRTQQGLEQYLAAHRAIAASPSAPPALRALYTELDPIAEITRLVTTALDGAGPSWHAGLSSTDLRLTTGDAGPHNVLVADDGRLTVVDLESSGWDHPLAFATDFLTHDQSLELPHSAVDAFISAYRAEAELPDAGWAELPRACVLRHIFWCAIHLTAADPAVMARRRFADPTFDPDEYLAAQMGKFRRRLSIAVAAVDRLA